LEFFEVAGIGQDMRDDGLARLFRTTPLIRKIDLEEANEITDEILIALTPDDVNADDSKQIQPGSQLEHISLSYAIQITNDALLGLIRNCPKLVSLEVDNTRISGAAVKEFVRTCRRKQARDAEIVAIDARGVGEGTVKELSGSTRTRKGWRGWEAQKLNYLDARDEEDLGVGQDECDSRKVTVKTFYSWQAVDAVEAAREKRRKSCRRLTRSSSADNDDSSTSRPTSRWWSPGSRRFGSQSSSPLLSNNYEREGCVIM
jgi:F-box/leucine-rich repeat protein 2/20